MNAPDYPSTNDRISRQLACVMDVVMEEILRRGLVMDEIVIGEGHPTIKVHFTEACLEVKEAVWWRLEATPAGRKTDWIWVTQGVRIVWTSVAPPVVH